MKRIFKPIKKGEVPNAIAVAVTCFAHMHQSRADYNHIIEALELKSKTKKGSGFASKREKEDTDAR